MNRGEQHKHVTAFHLRLGLDRSVRLEILGETLENVKALLRVSHLTAAEHDGDLNARALLEETQNVALLGLVVANVVLGRNFISLTSTLDWFLRAALAFMACWYLNLP